MTSPFVAGQKIHASDLNIFIAGAASSGDVTCTTTTLTDLTGATVTFSTTHANVICTVTGIFDVSLNTAAAAATGHLSVDGSDQTTQAILTMTTATQRATIAQCWTIALAAAGSHTLKLRGALSASAGSYTFFHPHTTINALVCDL